MAVRFADAARATFTPESGPRTGLMAGVGAAAITVAALADPETIEDGPVLCPFRLVTGLPCPGCGLTRSWVYLLHGHWSAAMTANPFGVVLLGATVMLLVAVVAAIARHERVPSVGRLMSSRPVAALASLWITFGVVRLVAVATGVTSG